MIKLKAEEINHFINNNPRDYDLFIFFNFDKCVFCKDILGKLEDISKLYFDNKSFEAYKNLNNTIFRPILFFNIDYNYQINNKFKKLINLKNNPALYFSKVEDTYTDIDDKIKNLNKNIWIFNRKNIKIKELLRYINLKTNRNYEFKKSNKILKKLLLILFIALIFLIILFKFFYKYIINTKFWYFGSLVIYFFCSSGYLYSKKYNNTLIGYINNEYEFISNGKQYIIEGFIIAAMIISFGFIFLLTLFLLKSKKDLKFTHIIILSINTFILIYLYFTLEKIFETKNFYNPWFYPPSYYNRRKYN